MAMGQRFIYIEIQLERFQEKGNMKREMALGQRFIYSAIWVERVQKKKNLALKEVWSLINVAWLSRTHHKGYLGMGIMLLPCACLPQGWCRVWMRVWAISLRLCSRLACGTTLSSSFLPVCFFSSSSFFF